MLFWVYKEKKMTEDGTLFFCVFSWLIISFLGDDEDFSRVDKRRIFSNVCY